MRTTLLALMGLMPVALPARADDCHSNLMIVLDRSCSMQDPPKAGGTMSKWQLAGNALMTITTKYAGMVDFGLIMFPDQTGNNCLQDGNIYVNVGPLHESMVTSTVMTTMPTGPCVTDIKPGVDQVATDPIYKNPYTGMGARSFVLFISDGMQTCGGNDNMVAASFAALYANGYPSYILGFGGAVSPAALDQYATAGGVPRAAGDGGGALYYQADDAATLEAALDEIVGTVASAEFSSCPGVPCPDGRCFVAGQTCVNGSCVGPGGGGGNGDGGSGGGGGGGDGGSGGGTGGKGSSGCSCNVGGIDPIPPLAFLWVALGAVRLRRRRD